LRALLAGNWKMNGLRASLSEIRALSRALADTPAAADVLVCPPFALIAEAARDAQGTDVAIGAQNCHPAPSGAFTGEVSAEMLKDAGAKFVILGHSERRQYQGETDVLIAQKVSSAKRAGLTAIVCVGEIEAERDAGNAIPVVEAQLDGSIPDEANPDDLVIAYEPVWAIGTGRTPTLPQIAEMHGFIRSALTRRFGAEGAGIRILYGGSVKPANAAVILTTDEVGGALVGGASLKAAEFLAIIRATPGQYR
jgi:triosephosphate isomerase